MKEEQQYDVAVVGGGILGLAIAYFAAQKGNRVVVFERNKVVQGASLHNFGLIWPIGQHPNKLSRAMRTREVWLQLARKTGFWVGAQGSLTLAHREDEFHVLEEFMATRKNAGYQCELLTPVKTIAKSHVVNPIKLEGSLWSKTELTLDTRQAIPAIQQFLKSEYNVSFKFEVPINKVEYPFLINGKEQWQAERIFICNGNDLASIYPNLFTQIGLQKRKLKLMRTIQQPSDWKLNLALASGLTLQNFPSFEHCESLALIKNRLNREMQANKSWGSQFIITQSSLNEIIIGDSREYDLKDQNFELAHTFENVLKSIGKLIRIPSMRINETWSGAYTKIVGDSEFVASVQSHVIIANGLGGFGLTNAFGLAEELIEEKIPVKKM